MKSKLTLQALAVCCSVALLGAYVVYAHRQAQPPALEAAPPHAPVTASEPVIESEGFVHDSPPTQSGGDTNAPALNPNSKTEEHAISASTIDGPIFRNSSRPSTSQKPATPPSNTSNSPSNHSTALETVDFRTDGSTVTTRIVDTKAPTFAPSSKAIILPVFSTRTRSRQTIEATPAKPVQVNGKILKPGTFRNSEPPKLITVVPPPTAPRETAPNPALQTVAQPTHTPTAPRETFIFSTKSAPVFVAPRTAPVDTTPLAMGTPIPTAGLPVAGAPPALPPHQPDQTKQTVTPKPRFLAPGSKSIDLLLLEKAQTPQPTQKAVPVTPAQTPTQPKAP